MIRTSWLHVDVESHGLLVLLLRAMTEVVLHFISRVSNQECPTLMQECPNWRLGHSPRPLPQKWSQPGFIKYTAPKTAPKTSPKSITHTSQQNDESISTPWCWIQHRAAHCIQNANTMRKPQIFAKPWKAWQSQQRSTIYLWKASIITTVLAESNNPVHDNHDSPSRNQQSSFAKPLTSEQSQQISTI